ncbi:MAG: response regulator [Candidatus Cloacimonetes bacterium]|nr:response regulator [Candidatus Cloacimonadota bacterium]
MSKVLLVEDDTDMSEVFCDFLEMSGHKVHTAFNGKEGLALFQQDSFDIIVTDIIMPELDGLEMIKAILAIKPDTAIITLSGGHRLVPEVATQYLDASIKLGAARSFCKPFKMTDLLTAIDELCS